MNIIPPILGLKTYWKTGTHLSVLISITRSSQPTCTCRLVQNLQTSSRETTSLREHTISREHYYSRMYWVTVA